MGPKENMMSLNQKILVYFYKSDLEVIKGLSGARLSNLISDNSEIAEDESLSEVVDTSAQSELLSIYDAMNGEVTEEKLQEAIKPSFG